MSESTRRAPASGSRGFFQAHPVLRNQFEEDATLHRCTCLFTAPATFSPCRRMLTSFGTTVLKPRVSATHPDPLEPYLTGGLKIFAWIADAERNGPFVKGDGFTALGHPEADSLVTSEGWRCLQALGIREGVVATGYEVGAHHDAESRVIQMLKLHLWSASSAYVACPSAMQDGAVVVLKREMARLNATPYAAFPSGDYIAADSRKVFARALERLTSRDPSIAWTSGQWMTERAGGSDVRGTETVATWAGATNAADGTDIDGSPLGPWRIDGFKWFSSATDCGMAILLAQTGKGVSCFFAPTRKLVTASDGSSMQTVNGIRIQRLKTKLGTRALPTAELEIAGMRAWLVGEEGTGVKVISGMLTVTRVYNAGELTTTYIALSDSNALVTAMSHLGRGLAIVRAYAPVRTFPSQPNMTLSSLPLFAQTTADVARSYRSYMLLTFLVTALLGASEHTPALDDSSPNAHLSQSTALPKSPAYLNGLIPPENADVLMLLRLLTPIAKACTAKCAIAGLQECMEALGGVGYCENQENQEMNVARLFRDANVLAIWEGTTDVMVTDFVKAIVARDGKQPLQTLDKWVQGCLRGDAMREQRQAILRAWEDLRAKLESRSKEDMILEGRDIVDQVCGVVRAVLLIADAVRDHDPVAIECAESFVHERFGSTMKHDWREANRRNVRIAFGSRQGVMEKL